MKQKMRALQHKLTLATYAKDKVTRFQLSPASDISDLGVCVPVPIMYRFYHLARAYDLPQLKNFSPTGNVAVDFIAMRFLITEIQALQELVDDPVVQFYGDQLTTYMSGTSVDTKSRLVFSS